LERSGWSKPELNTSKAGSVTIVAVTSERRSWKQEKRQKWSETCSGGGPEIRAATLCVGSRDDGLDFLERELLGEDEPTITDSDADY
jgi:hypothetical protein